MLHIHSNTSQHRGAYRLSSATVAATLENLSDEQLAALAHIGDIVATNTLLGRYQGFVRSKARGYFLIGADSEDLVQEGMIGLFKSIRDFEPERSAFRAFAEVCVVRQIITAIKTATRQKHRPLNSYVSIHLPEEDEETDESTDDLLGIDDSGDPAHYLLFAEEARGVRVTLSALLSVLEVEVLCMYLEGRSYREIAVNVGRRAKSVDNALQRIKRKVEEHLEVSPSLAYAS